MANSPLTDSNGVVSITILCDGTAIATTIEIVSVDIQFNLNRISTATLVLNDGDMPNATFPLSETETFKPGALVTIQLGL